MKYLLFLLFFSYTINTSAQHQLSGFILTSDKLPVENARILLHSLSDSAKPLVAFTNSDKNGFYTVEIPGVQTYFRVTVRAGSYQNIEKIFDLSRDTIISPLDFVLHPSVSYLDTVQVNMKFTISVTGDTLTFNPDAYSRKNETTIEQLLANIPGIDIKDDGRISFNGTPITNVLIDGDDLFKKNYQQLTQNAAPKILDKIEVIKNYQKDQLLKEFNKAGSQVINLKLKDKYKNYLFGNASAGYGDQNNKLADLFLIKLSPQTKIQAGGNYNTTGSTYATTGKISAEDILAVNESSFFSYDPVSPVLSINHYYFQYLPMYYQQRNKSMQGHSNILFKKKKWENVLNIKFASDTVQRQQKIQTTYSDGTNIFQNDQGSERNQLQEYNFTSSKNSEKESIYINASLNNKIKRYVLGTESNQSLNSIQRLDNSNLSWQVNLSYNKRLNKNILWSNTMGYFDQAIHENLRTNPDFLFWLFPEHLSLNELWSAGGNRFRYAKLKSELYINKSLLSHIIGLSYTADQKTFSSNLTSLRFSDDSLAIPFENNSHFQNRILSMTYTGNFRLSEKNSLTLKMVNEPDFIQYKSDNQSSEKAEFFYDYAIGITSKKRAGGINFNLGMKRQLANNSLFFPNYVQTSFHELQSGFIRPYGTQSTYLQLMHNLISIKKQLTSSFMLSLSHNHDEFVRSLNTTAIGTVHSFTDNPNNTNSLILFFRMQKAIGNLPLSVNTNILLNWRSIVYEFNEEIKKSDLSMFNGTIGMKSLFESFFNFDYKFSIFHSSNKIKSPTKAASNAETLLNKFNGYFVMKKVFNATITLNNMSDKNITFNGNFLDIAVSRKMLKEKLLVELNARNLFDNKEISNQIISPYSIQENSEHIRGREFFLKVRYEIR